MFLNSIVIVSKFSALEYECRHCMNGVALLVFFVKTFCFCKRPERYRDSPVTETEKEKKAPLAYVAADNAETESSFCTVDR